MAKGRFLAFVAGATAGTVLALLSRTEKGKALRKDLQELALEGLDKLEERFEWCRSEEEVAPDTEEE